MGTVRVAFRRVPGGAEIVHAVLANELESKKPVVGGGAKVVENRRFEIP